MNNKILINKSALISICVTLLYLFFYIGIVTFIPIKFQNVQCASIIGIILIMYIFFSWKKSYYRILSPYFIFIVILYLTLCGQTIPWAFNIQAGYRDLTIAKYNGIEFSNSSICRALFFSYLCILMTHTVVLNNIDTNTKHMRTRRKRKDNSNCLNPLSVTGDFNLYKIMVGLGIILCLTTALPYFFYSMKQYAYIIALGYGSQYENVSYGIGSIMGKIGEFYPVGAITLLYAWGKKNNYNKSNYIIKACFAYSIVASYLLMELLLSQRTGVLLFAIALLFVFFSDKKIPRNLIVLGAISVFVLMAGMRMIDLMRSGAIHNLNDFFAYSLSSQNNPVLDFLGDIGWNLMTTIEFQEVIPSARPFGLGFTYIISLTSIIPNLNFWQVHPATVYGNISAWLQEYLNFSFGIGCTPVAEAFYNFGDLGWLVFIVWGMFISYMNQKFEDSSSILNNYQVVLFMGILLKSAVRSSIYAVFRPYVFFIVIPVVAVRYLYKFWGSKKHGVS